MNWFNWRLYSVLNEIFKKLKKNKIPITKDDFYTDTMNDVLE